MTPTTRLIAKVILLVLFTVVVWWLISSLDADIKPKPPETVTPVEATTSIDRVIKSVTPPVSERTVESLIAQQGSYKCQTSTAGTSPKHNVIYIADGKMRAEFPMDTGRASKASITVYDGRFLYSWKVGALVGRRVAVTSMQQFPTTIPGEFINGAIHDSTYEITGWSCTTWTANHALLAAPLDVKFTF